MDENNFLKINKMVKPCKSNERRNPTTNRCVKKGSPTYNRVFGEKKSPKKSSKLSPKRIDSFIQHVTSLDNGDLDKFIDERNYLYKNAMIEYINSKQLSAYEALTILFTQKDRKKQLFCNCPTLALFILDKYKPAIRIDLIKKMFLSSNKYRTLIPHFIMYALSHRYISEKTVITFLGTLFDEDSTRFILVINNIVEPTDDVYKDIKSLLKYESLEDVVLSAFLFDDI